MYFSEFRVARLEELRTEWRCLGATLRNEHNQVGGLIDLVEQTKPKSVLEIGSNRGVSTEVFLLRCAYVVAVDPWPDGDGDDKDAYAAFMQRCGPYPQLKVIRGYSPEAIEQFHRMFDLVYIDAVHDRPQIDRDIAAGVGVLKLGGYLAGHDYSQFEVIRRAISEFGSTRCWPAPQVFSDSSWLVRT
jgi:predicted O-methyltransferase YrrM